MNPAPEPTIALIGNPNCGKTTLFNALTGLRQKIANYPGVTVEKKVGSAFGLHGQKFQVVDLPGTYSLLAQSPDERITTEVFLGLRADTPAPDLVICVVDASNLERNLFLVSQVLESGRPVIVVLNMVDLVEKKGEEIDIAELSKQLGCPVVASQATIKKGLVDLRATLSQTLHPSVPLSNATPEFIQSRLDQWKKEGIAGVSLASLSEQAKLQLLLMEANPETLAAGFHWENLLPEIARAQKELDQEHPNWREAWVSARYDRLHEIGRAVTRTCFKLETDVTDKIDAVVTHSLWGWVCFFGIMSLLFLSIFVIAEYPMNWIEDAFNSLSVAVKTSMPEGDLRDLLTDGVIAGVGGVVVFLPQILILFFFIGLLEDTGYMSRAAFIMDRVMSRVGLHGKSFIPLLSGYACAIPGVMASRTIENPKDRLATIMVLPFMSCSARLPVYALMISTLFPQGEVSVLTKAAVMMAMYLIGTLSAFAFAALFKKTIFKSDPLPLLMELPPYRRPALSTILHHMFDRAKAFLQRAGTIILGLSILLWFLTTYPKTDSTEPSAQLSQSIAGHIGHWMEPALKPLGFNWKIGIGLVGAQAAREIFVSTLSVVYSVETHEEDTSPLRDALLADHWPDGSPVFTPLVCITLMIFFVLSMQCVATLAIVKRETNSWRWPIFLFTYMTLYAYLASLIVYQTGRFFGL